ncbi:MAG TPA: hypothetical protein VGR47_06880 [Terracidiphilus sp.]|nr:hypothetical protein [Terracidiphilus sp.]
MSETKQRFAGDGQLSDTMYPASSSPALDALEDLNVEDIFDLSDLPTDSRLCHMHTLSGGGEATRLSDRDNVSKMTEFEMVEDTHASLQVTGPSSAAGSERAVSLIDDNS